MNAEFQNKTVLVTGGSCGIGRATALAFAQRGANVVIAGWKDDPERTAIRPIEEAGGNVRFIPCDVSDSSEVEKMFEEIFSTSGSLDFTFNNAGIEGTQATAQEMQ